MWRFLQKAIEIVAIEIFFSLFENCKRKTKKAEHPLNIFPLHTNDHLRREKKQQECAKDTLGSWNHCIKRGVNLKDIVFSYMHGRPWLLQFDKWNPNIFDTKKQRVSKFKVLHFDMSHSKTRCFLHIDYFYFVFIYFDHYSAVPKNYTVWNNRGGYYIGLFGHYIKYHVLFLFLFFENNPKKIIVPVQLFETPE